jgi:hypothetical protein
LQVCFALGDASQVFASFLVTCYTDGLSSTCSLPAAALAASPHSKYVEMLIYHKFGINKRRIFSIIPSDI